MLKGLGRKHYQEVLLPILFHWQPSMAAVCIATGWISHGKQHLMLNRERGVTETSYMNEAFFIRFVFMPSYPFLIPMALKLQWTTFPYWFGFEMTSFLAFPHQQKSTVISKSYLDKQQFWKCDPYFSLYCGKWLSCFVCGGRLYLYPAVWNCKRRKGKKAFSRCAKLLLASP